MKLTYSGETLEDFTMTYLLGVIQLHGFADEQTGDCEAPTGFVSRIGKRLFFEDSQGFTDSERFATIDLARERFNEIDAKYSAWSHEHEFPCWVCGDNSHCECTCSYCETCADYHTADGRHD